MPASVTRAPTQLSQRVPTIRSRASSRSARVFTGRTGVAAGIARAGREAPGLDYIMWLARFR